MCRLRRSNSREHESSHARFTAYRFGSEPETGVGKTRWLATSPGGMVSKGTILLRALPTLLPKAADGK